MKDRCLILDQQKIQELEARIDRLEREKTTLEIGWAPSTKMIIKTLDIAHAQRGNHSRMLSSEYASACFGSSWDDIG